MLTTAGDKKTSYFCKFEGLGRNTFSAYDVSGDKPKAHFSSTLCIKVNTGKIHH